MKKNNRFRRSALPILLTALTVLFSACGQTPAVSSNAPAVSSDAPEVSSESAPKKTVTILYTNDVHAYLDNDSGEEGGLSYAQLAGLKAELGENVLLVDAGDHVQGSVYGAMDQGESVLEIMNDLYDVATIGNHEFDYGMERMLYLTEHSKYPYVCCNFVHKETGEPVLKPHEMLTVGNVKIGFVGITTPETVNSTAPSRFQDGQGNFIYEFLDGDKLFEAVQNSVDALKAQGADYIIAVSHMGVDELSKTTSRTVIQNVSGLDAVIDGHSHSEIEKELVQDKAGNEVVLTQTGCFFANIGKMTLSESGVETELVKESETADEAIAARKAEWVQSVDEMLGEKIGVLAAPLLADDENGKRVVRVSAANVGEFVADAYYYYVNFVDEIDCDVAIINGGGLRASVEAGEISYKSLKTVNPFGNMLCAVKVTGQQLLDMLEWGAHLTTGVAGENEEGSFLHTAGLRYTVDTSVVSTVQQDAQSLWTGAPTGEYRVKDVMIYDKAEERYVDLDLAKTYCVAGANYTLVSKGGGFEMIDGQTVKDYIVEDYMALAAYAVAFEDIDGDDLSDVASANSPLCAYKGYGINYESPVGEKRVNVQ